MSSTNIPRLGKAFVMVSGSRSVTDRDYVFSKLDLMLSRMDPTDVVIVCGYNPETKQPKGVDRLVYEYAHSRKGMHVIAVPAMWDAFGKAAGPTRNNLMCSLATHFVAFWDGESAGTRSAIDMAKHWGLVSKVFNLGEEK